MPIGLLFWVLMLLWMVSVSWSRWPGQTAPPFVLFGGSLLEFILFFLLGWRVFGFVIQG